MNVDVLHTAHMVDDQLDAYQQFQVDRYGNILASTGELLTMDQVQEQKQEKELEWLSAKYEAQMLDHIGY